MTPRERIEKLLKGEAVDRPPFMPAIYDLKPVFIDAPLHTFGQNKEELIRSLQFEVEELHAEALTVAYDIYNIEAEAIGAIISRNPAIGMPEVSEPILQDLADLSSLPNLSEIAGRMPLFVDSCEKVQQEFGDTIPVRAGISGPFSMAAKICPQDNLLLDTMMNPEGVHQLLVYSTKIIKLYIEAYLKTGVGVVIFDSFVSPPMISPEIYRELVLPFHQELFGFLKENDVLQRTLIVGGDTTTLIPDFVKTGATQLLLDYSIPLAQCKEILQEFDKMVFRINLPPALFCYKDTSELETYLLNVLEALRDCSNLIIGTGILPPNAIPENILFAKNQLTDFYN